MAKYRLTEDGVHDTERGLWIPARETNRYWVEFQDWLADGNVADPYVPRVETVADQLQQTDAQMIRTIDWILETLVAKGVITLAEIPQALKDLYVARKALRNA